MAIINNKLNTKKESSTNTEPRAPFNNDYETMTRSSRCGDDLNVISDPLEGTPLPVTYYNQLLHRDDNTHHIDTHLSPSFQQVRKIKDLVLRIRDPLTVSIDPNTNVSITSGSSVLINVIIPNIGDTFIADLDDNLPYLFRVTVATPLTYRESTHYLIEYTMVRQIDLNSNEYRDLESKVDTSYNFTSSSSGTGVVLSEEFDQAISVEKSLTIIGNDYHNNFIDIDTDFLLHKFNGETLYDPNIVNFVKRTGLLSYSTDNRQMRQVHLTQQPNRHNILDNILQRDINNIIHLTEEIPIVSASSLHSKRNLGYVYYTPVNYFVVDGNKLNLSQPDGSSFNSILNPTNEDLTNLYPTTTTRDTIEVPLIKPVLIDNKYIFSEGFYSNTDMSLLELLVKDYINNTFIDSKDVKILIEDYKNWLDLEKIYYTPIVYVLAKYVFNQKIKVEIP